MNESSASVLIVVKSGPLREGLQALLTAMPQVHAVEWVSDLSSALRMPVERAPTLVLLDSGLVGSETWLAMRQTKAKWPRARCVFLADSVQQQVEAEAAGADAVMLKGILPAKLIATIVRLLPRQGEKEQRCDVVVSSAQHNHRTRRFGRQYRLVL